jgi:hypothetical protein
MLNAIVPRGTLVPASAIGLLWLAGRAWQWFGMIVVV